MFGLWTTNPRLTAAAEQVKLFRKALEANTEALQALADLQKELHMAVIERGQAIIDRINKLSDTAKVSIATAVAAGISNAEANKDGDANDTFTAIEGALSTAETTVDEATTPAVATPATPDVDPATGVAVAPAQ